MKGKIKHLVPLRGYGFITGENGEEVFFHRSALRGEDFDALEKGTRVEFTLTLGPKGPRAANVRVAE